MVVGAEKIGAYVLSLKGRQQLNTVKGIDTKGLNNLVKGGLCFLTLALYILCGTVIDKAYALDFLETDGTF